MLLTYRLYTLKIVVLYENNYCILIVDSIISLTDFGTHFAQVVLS